MPWQMIPLADDPFTRLHPPRMHRGEILAKNHFRQFTQGVATPSPFSVMIYKIA
jgi:hypothetical protein